MALMRRTKREKARKMICPHCQSENREGAKFCDECGASLLADADKTQIIEPVRKEGGAEAIAPIDASASAACEQTAAEDDKEAPGCEPPSSAESNESDEFAEAELEEDLEDALDLPAETPESPSAHRSDPHLDDVLPRIDRGEAERIDSLSSEKTQIIDLDGSKTADFSGFERLVDSSYVPPARSWRAGDTMELPKIEGEPAPSQKKYEAPDTDKERHSKRTNRIVGIIAAVVVVAAIALAATYHFELWGGKIVPDVTGEAQADAAWLLESKGFDVRAVQVKSDEVEGVVLITDPAAGARIAEGAIVNMSVATPRAVPDIAGKTQDEAKAALDKEGLANVTFTTVKSDEAEGTVLEVSPEAGTKVKSATAITVTVAEAYTVPDVAGKSQEEASAALKDAGFAVNFETKYTEDSAEGAVLTCDPAAGTKAKSGSTVTITVAKSRAKELVAETQSLFSKGATVVIGGVNCEVVSCDSVSFEGNNTVSYTITAKKFEKTSLFGTLFTNAEQMSGTITWNSDNSIASSNPKLSK